MLSQSTKILWWARPREGGSERQERDGMNRDEPWREEKKRGRAGPSKLNRWRILIIRSTKKCHAASQADRQSSFIDTGVEKNYNHYCVDRGETGSLESPLCHCAFVSDKSSPALKSIVNQFPNNQILKVYIYYLTLVEVSHDFKIDV